MKADPEKFQFIFLRNIGSHTLQIGDITTKPVPSVTLVGITIDSVLLKNDWFYLRRPQKILT